MAEPPRPGGRTAWHLLILAVLLSGLIAATAVAVTPAGDRVETFREIVEDALRQGVGAPARADIGDQATVRLAEGLIMLPREPGSRLLAARKVPIPPDIAALLLGTEGVDALGPVRWVPAGFIDSDAALGWTAADMLSSLNNTVARENTERAGQNLQEREARRWVKPPRYDAATHQLQWAALIVPKSAPRDSDGEITWHAVGFGRAGYVELSVVTSVEKAEAIGRMADDFLAGLRFRPGQAYGDALATDPRAASGLAGAMGIDVLHTATSTSKWWTSDAVVPVAGGIVAAIGAISLFLHIRRQSRRDARRG